MKDHITLKWGTLKSWTFGTPECKRLFRRYAKIGMSLGAAQQEDTPEQKELICKMIDASDVKTVYLDWDGINVSKEKAKEYVRNYGKENE